MSPCHMMRRVVYNTGTGHARLLETFFRNTWCLLLPHPRYSPPGSVLWKADPHGGHQWTFLLSGFRSHGEKKVRGRKLRQDCLLHWPPSCNVTVAWLHLIWVISLAKKALCSYLLSFPLAHSSLGIIVRSPLALVPAYLPYLLWFSLNLSTVYK